MSHNNRLGGLLLHGAHPEAGPSRTGSPRSSLTRDRSGDSIVAVPDNQIASVVNKEIEGMTKRHEDWEKQFESADAKQAELFNLQWKLIREQTGNLTRELATVRQEVHNLRLGDQRSEAKFHEVERRLVEQQTHVTESIEGERAQRVANDEKSWAGLAEFRISLDEESRLRVAACDGLDQGLKRQRQNLEVEVKHNSQRLSELAHQISALSTTAETDTRERQLIEEHSAEESKKIRANLDASTRRIASLQEGLERESAERRASEDTVRGSVREALEREERCRTSALEELKRLPQQLRSDLEEEARVRRDADEQGAQNLQNGIAAISAELRLESEQRMSSVTEATKSLQQLRQMHEKECRGRSSTIEDLSQTLTRRTEELEQQVKLIRLGAETERELLQKKCFEIIEDNTRGHDTLQEKLAALEQKLHDQIARECQGREADIDELRKIMGVEQQARTEHHNHILTSLEEEKARREEAHTVLHGKIDWHGTAMQGHIDGLHGRLVGHSETLQDRLAREQSEREALHASLHGRLDEHATALDDRITRQKEDLDGRHSELHALHQSMSEALRSRFDREQAAREEAHGDLHSKLHSHHGTVQERIEDLEKEVLFERRAREAIQAFLGQEKQPREAEHVDLQSSPGACDDADSKMHNSLREQLEAFEQKLRTEIATESHGRAEDIKDLRTMIGGESSARLQHHENILGTIQNEKANRDAVHSSLQHKFDEHSSTTTSFIDNRLNETAASLQESIKREQMEREALHSSVHAKIENLGSALQSGLDEFGQADSGRRVALHDKFEELEQRLHEQIARECEGREQDIDDVRKLIGGEQAARSDHHNHIMKQFEEEKTKRDAVHATLCDKLDEQGSAMKDHSENMQGRLDNHVESLGERFASDQRERESLDSTLQVSLQNHAVTIEERLSRHQAEVDEQHSALRDGLHGSLDDHCKAIQGDLGRHRQDVDSRHAELHALHQSMSSVLDTHQETVQESLGQEQEARASKETEQVALHDALHGRLGELDEMHSQRHSSIQEQLDALERKLHEEVGRECNVREQDIQELRKLLGSEQKLQSDHHTQMMEQKAEQAADHKALQVKLDDQSTSMQGHVEALNTRLDGHSEAIDERLALEKEERGAAHAQVHDRIDEHTTAMKGNVDRLHERLDAHAATLEERLKREQKEGEVLHTTLLGRLDDLSGNLQESITREQAEREALHSSIHCRLEDHTGAFEDRLTLEQAEREALQASLNSRLVVHASTLEERLTQEKSEREVLHATLHGRLDADAGTLEQRLAREQAAREASHALMHDRHQDHAGKIEDRLNLHKTEVHQQHTALRDGMHSSLDEHRQHLDKHKESLQERIERESTDRDSVHGAFHDAVQGHLASEKSAHDEHLNSVQERLEELERKFPEEIAVHHGRLEDYFLREKSERESGYESIHEAIQSHGTLLGTMEMRLLRERELQERQQGDLSDRMDKAQLLSGERWETAEDRMDSLERQTNIYDGLLRTERSERQDESRRLWDAMDNHTHDLSATITAASPSPLQSNNNSGTTLSPQHLHGAVSPSPRAPTPRMNHSLLSSRGSATPVPMSPVPAQMVPTRFNRGGSLVSMHQQLIGNVGLRQRGLSPVPPALTVLTPRPSTTLMYATPPVFNSDQFSAPSIAYSGVVVDTSSNVSLSVPHHLDGSHTPTSSSQMIHCGHSRYNPSD